MFGMLDRKLSADYQQRPKNIVVNSMGYKTLRASAPYRLWQGTCCQNNEVAGCKCTAQGAN